MKLSIVVVDKVTCQIKTKIRYLSYSSTLIAAQVDNIEHDGKADGDDGVHDRDDGVNNVHKRFYRYCMTWLSKQKGQCGQQYWA